MSEKHTIIPIEPVDSEEMMTLVDSGGQAKISFSGHDGEFMMKKNGSKGYLFTPIKKPLSEDEKLMKAKRVSEKLKELSDLLKAPNDN